jgi:hypothetical protein
VRVTEASAGQARDKAVLQTLLAGGGLQLTVVAVGLISLPFVTRSLTTAEYGVYATLMSVALLTSFADFGIGSALTNRVTSALAVRREDELKVAIPSAVVSLTGIAILVSLVGLGATLQGSSIDPVTIEQVYAAEGYERVLVILDSNHTHDHVLAELEAYAPLTTIGSYCIGFDTVAEDLPDSLYPNRPWGKGDNPKTAVWAYLRELESTRRIARDGQSLTLQQDPATEAKLLIAVAPQGYLKRTQ